MATLTAKYKPIKALVDSAGNQIFSAFFTKEDGTIRHMVCRRNVRKGVTGKGMKFDPAEKGLIPVFDFPKYREQLAANGGDEEAAAKKSFRMLNTGTTFAIRVHKTPIILGGTPEGFELPESYQFDDYSDALTETE